VNITLTGATGFIGRRLVADLLARGHSLTVISRRRQDGGNPAYVLSDLTVAPPPPSALERADAVINLAGEPVAQRWTEDAKRRIRASRVDATRRLVQAMAALARKPAVLVSASAVGYYGDRGDEVLTEDARPGAGFLERVTVDWEHEAERAVSLGVRVVRLRIGVALGRDGGALAKMLPAFQAGVGGRIGSGRQWMSWIHIDDLVGLILFALDRPELAGAVNAVAPNPIRNVEFVAELARALRWPAFIPAPAFALRLMFGEMAAVLLASQRVQPEAAIRAGYTFRYPELRPALADLCRAAGKRTL
jgi:uncharacterized protein (TIGR01777 family)